MVLLIYKYLNIMKPFNICEYIYILKVYYLFISLYIYNHIYDIVL